MSNTDTQWFFNIETGEVERGKASSFSNRMGPYASAEEARHALDIAEARNKAADTEDEKDDEWD
ncbi:hypothetical protein [Corynebacterium rouxii]|uniref:SPOR domain-containing protein n=1 Tax=Corynebacterium rouxii TaxID=2719119 RepID=A0A6I8MGW1_9CORY|nr:hypothetical protein [Corynebacterium rouxii]MDT9409249.1 hypothetical protein [Corynebacterium rouxii]MDT9411482.1 hypothetical protein [Corynebacterium rouxii]VZH85757.1 hypothetical protein FRC0190_01694 [Corynebacterium rouxii]